MNNIKIPDASGIFTKVLLKLKIFALSLRN